MRRLLQFACLLSLAASSMGCAMCCGSYDNAYGYYGGQWQRDDLCNGRVGSAFHPAGGPTYTSTTTVPSSEPAVLPPPLPPAGETPDDAATAKPRTKSVKRTRPSSQYLPATE